MREFWLVIDEALHKGLSPEESTPINSQFLFECLGFRLGRAGLEAFQEGENPLPSTLDLHYSWPFPQMIASDTYNILIVRDSIVNEDAVYSVSADMNTITHIFTVDALTFGTGYRMELADFGEYAFMTNGVVMIYWDTLTLAWQATTGETNIPLLGTICNFNGQAVGGCVLSAWHDCDETFYIWSKIGEMDFTPDRQNEAGYRRCPFGGEVYHVRKLTNYIIGYSSKGLTIIYPVSSPAATFGFRELSDIGPINRGAMDGNFKKHLYIGSDLVVRLVTEEGVKELGYKHLMDELDNEDIIVNYDRSTGDFFIGNSVKTFLLSPYGMTEIQQHPSTVWRTDPDNVYMLPATVDSFYPTITSGAFDFGYRGQKTTAVVETDAFYGDDPEASVDYSFDNINWSTSLDFIPINDQGVATIVAAGVMFRVKIRFSQIYDLFKIGYMLLRYKMTDLRSVRGIQAPPPRGQ